MNCCTAAEYRALLFRQLEERGVTKDHVQRLWRVLNGDAPTATRLYNALTSVNFTQPHELLTTGYPANDVREAHELALRMIKRSVETILELASQLEERESAQRAAEAEWREAQMRKVFAETSDEPITEDGIADQAVKPKAQSKDEGVGHATERAEEPMAK